MSNQAGQYMGNDISVVINTVDLSNHVRKITVDQTAEALDNTAMGDSTKSHKGGLKGWTIDIEFLQNHTGSSVDATLSPLLGTTTSVVVKPTSSAVGATNPSFTGTALLVGYKPFDVNVGDMAGAVSRFVSAGALTRATT